MYSLILIYWTSLLIIRFKLFSEMRLILTWKSFKFNLSLKRLIFIRFWVIMIYILFFITTYFIKRFI